MLDSYVISRISTAHRTYVQVPEGHPALIELERLGVLALCVMVGSGMSGRPKVFLFQQEDWEAAITRQRGS
jgi:hypothetical protein